MSIPHFHKLKVCDIRKETPNCVSVALSIPKELESQFQYQAGQNITFKKEFNGNEIRRSYSLCSSPLENDFRVAIKQVDEGLFSTYANNNLKIGDIVEVMTPTGHFTISTQKENKKNYMAFAAGSGITPIISIIKTVLLEEPQSSFTLIFGNQNFQSIIFREEIENLKNKYIGRFQVVHILSREHLESDLNNGRINHEKCTILFDKSINLNSIDDFFMCGPEEMIWAIKIFLEQNNIEKNKIHFELFTTENNLKAKQSFQEAHQHDKDKMSMITIKVDDRSIEFPLAYGGESILDAALKQGADLPFACKGGVCCTCRARVMEGTVEMEVNYALEQDEVEKGFVLTCQSHPTSDRVVIDFDER